MLTKKQNLLECIRGGNPDRIVNQWEAFSRVIANPVVDRTLDADGRITSAIGDMAEPALTVAADGGITAPEAVRTKLELGDSYGMRGASSLGKEWYEHSEGYCSYLKGKTEKEVADIPADGSDADLAALCTISIDALQKAAGDAFENASL